MKFLFYLACIFIAVGFEGATGQNDPEPSSKIIVGDLNDVHKATFAVPGNSSFKLQISVPVENVSFYVVQIHSYLQSVSLLHKDDVAKGTNIGLVVIPSGSNETFIVENDNPISIQFLAAVVPYGNGVPVPGGCSSKPLPMLNVTEMTNTLIISVTGAALDYGCTTKHRLFYRHTAERDFSLNTYLDAISSVISSSFDEITHFLIEVPFESEALEKLFASYPGTGILFVVIAEHNGTFSAYVPAHTFSCPGGDITKCQVIESTYVKVGIVFLSVLGLLLCFFGRSWEFFELTSISLVLGGAVAFCVLYDEDDLYTTKYVWMCAAAGATVAVAALFMKAMIRSKHLIHDHISLGTLSAFVCCLIYFIFIDILPDDYWYWGTFGATTVSFLFLQLLYCRSFGHVLASTVLGSYLIILPLDLAGTSLKYIYFDVVRRARVPHFNEAYLSSPTQTPDVVLVVVYLSIIFLGILLQKKRCNRPRAPANTGPTDTTPLLA